MQSFNVLYLHRIPCCKSKSIPPLLHKVIDAIVHLQGLIVSAITGVGYSVVQSQILRLPTIRKKMGLPYLTKQDPPKFRESVLWAKEKFQDMQKTVEQKSKEDLARRRKEQIRKDAATEMEAMKRLGGRRNLL